MSEEMSPLESARLSYAPKLPELLKDVNHASMKAVSDEKKPDEAIGKLFPKTFGQKAYELEKGSGKRGALSVGAVFSGGQAAGGHNVIAGIFDAIRQMDPKSRLIGFLGGPSGIVDNKWRELGEKEISRVRNLGGFDLIGSGRTKIETPEQMELALKACLEHKLDGLVVIGGDDSNTNAAVLAEYFLEKGCKTRVVGVPKTIDGDLRSEDIEISFGFDSACRTYSELIGNIARDSLSAKKYYHFIKLMGRSASHIALECALATHPNLCLIGEEKKSLEAIVNEIAGLIEKRKAAGKEYGVVLIPEGLIEFIPEMKALIQELNGLIAKGEGVEKLGDANLRLFRSLPERIQKQLLLDRDPHGNVTVSQIETEKLLMDLVKNECRKRGVKFSAQEHFFGYEGRACLPTNFDANYCTALGRLSAVAVRDGLTGMICAVQGLTHPPAEWRLRASPIVQMMRMEVRKGKEKPVIEKALVDMNGRAYVYYSALKKSWEIEDRFRYPGPIQFFGGEEWADPVPITLVV